jgi:hypothetical protein
MGIPWIEAPATLCVWKASFDTVSIISWWLGLRFDHRELDSHFQGTQTGLGKNVAARVKTPTATIKRINVGPTLDTGRINP